MNLFLSPHNDDETLFGSFTILRHKPHVVVCLKSQVQEDRHGITAVTREGETDQAMWWLQAASWEQFGITDTNPRYEEYLHDALTRLRVTYKPEIVWAPAIEDGGHEQHNGVGRVALDVFGEVQPYLTYRRGYLGSRGRQVPFEPSWIGTKLRAMSCYQSQYELPATRPWFTDNTLYEFTPWPKGSETEDGA